jgi:phospholipid/cholesterol/gamma-HCH transport system substrate-binding protein
MLSLTTKYLLTANNNKQKMMKISNETKVGALTAVSITLLILGFNFLKGKNVFKKKATMFVTFSKVEGLNIGDAIKINGLRVGAVEGLDEKDANLSEVVVSYHLTRSINIPVDSYGKIEATPLGSTAIVISLGTSGRFLKDGDTLKGVNSRGLMEDLKQTLAPTIEKINTTLASLDTTIKNIGKTFDESAQQNISTILQELAGTTDKLNAMLEPGKGSLAQTMDNVNSFSSNLKNNNDSISSVINNLAEASRKVATLDLAGTVVALESAIGNLNGVLSDIKSGKGSIGKLASDDQLYKNLNSTANSLNILLQDLRLHPKRYVQISVFGKKDKSGPLMTPISDSTSSIASMAAIWALVRVEPPEDPPPRSLPAAAAATLDPLAPPWS